MPRRYHREAPDKCYLCGVFIPWQRRRRNRRYCSNACKQTMYRVRLQVKVRALDFASRAG